MTQDTLAKTSRAKTAGAASGKPGVAAPAKAGGSAKSASAKPAAVQRDAAPVDGVVLTPAEAKSRRARSIAIALVLGALCLLFYTVTIVKLGPGVLVRPL